jgi:hypothetical protein
MTDAPPPATIDEWREVRNHAAKLGLLHGQDDAAIRQLPRVGVYVAQAISGVPSTDQLYELWCFERQRHEATSMEWPSGGCYCPAKIGWEFGVDLSWRDWMDFHRKALRASNAVWVIEGPGTAWLQSRGCLEEVHVAIDMEKPVWLPEIGVE